MVMLVFLADTVLKI